MTGPRMTDEKPNRKAWGSGRIAFIARLQTIKAEMQQGIPLTTIHTRHQMALGIGYQSFCKLVARYANDAKLVPNRVGSRDPSPRTRPATTPPPPAARTLPHARYEPAKPRTFEHDGNPRQDDEERLIGPRRDRK